MPAHLEERQQAGIHVRLMPLGDSITWGYQSTDGNGYRNTLYNALKKEGHELNFVGTAKNGNMSDPDNEGWPGYVIDQIAAKAVASVPSRLPNVYTANMGVNDCSKGLDPSTAGKRLVSAFHSLWTMTPDATIIMSTLTPNGNGGGSEANVVSVNAQYRALYNTWKSEGKRIVLAEFHDGTLAHPADFADALHPNDQGYAKMGNIWYNAIKEAEAAGFLVQPPAV